MLQRMRIILYLLSNLPDTVSLECFVRIVFLLSQHGCTSSSYDFLPYRSGPFSFTLNRDLCLLSNYGYISTHNGNILLCEDMRPSLCPEFERIPSSYKALLAGVSSAYSHVPPCALEAIVQREYPWYTLYNKFMNGPCKTNDAPGRASLSVYTSGYEGASIDAFLNNMLKAGIAAIVDVRAHPQSRKYGFSRSRLEALCNLLGISYAHVPRLGIPRSERSCLNGMRSYQRLFRRYTTALRSDHVPAIELVGQIMTDMPATLLCFEKDIERCHRKPLADELAHETGLSVRHL